METGERMALTSERTRKNKRQERLMRKERRKTMVVLNLEKDNVLKINDKMEKNKRRKIRKRATKDKK